MIRRAYYAFHPRWTAVDNIVETAVAEETAVATKYERHSHTVFRNINTGEERTVVVPSRRDSNYRVWIEWADGGETTLDKYRPPMPGY